MVRGSGKFKQKRGGGRQFRVMEVDKDGVAVSMDKPRTSRYRGNEEEEEDSDEDEEEEEEEEESEDEAEEEEDKAGEPELTRAQRREMKKKLGPKQEKSKEGEEAEEEDPDLINPNHVTKKMNISDLSKTRELSRRERGQKEKKEAKDRYWKLHQQGKTDEAKSDLARLAAIRKERETLKAQRLAEEEAKTAEADAKAQAQKASRSKRT